MPDPELLPEIAVTPELAPPVAGALAPGPYNFEFRTSDALRMTAHNSQSGVIVAIHYRMLTREGEIRATRHEFAPDATRTADTEEFVIGEGYLLNATVLASSGAPKRGQTFVRVQAIHGRGASATILGTIVQGYITGNQDRAWPGSPLEGSLEGDGYWRSLYGTDPAPGSEIAEVVPTGARWELMAFSAELTTNATAGNRRPVLLMSNGVHTYMRSPQVITSPASNTQRFFWGQGLALETAISPASPQAGVLIGNRMLAGHVLVTANENGTIGDNWSSPLLTVREWLEAP